MLKRCLLAAFSSLPLVFLPTALQAQATAAATRGGILQVGVAYSNANEDEFPSRLQGISLYSTFDLNAHLGVEGDVHLPSLISSTYNFTERSYDAGLRYSIHTHGLVPYGKVLIGVGQAEAPSKGEIVGGGAPGSYFLYAFGGGADIHLTDKINIRAIDFEYQRWPNFPPHSLTPSIISVGVAYRLR